MKCIATSDTMPWHIWAHEVQCAAIAMGAQAGAVMASCGKLRSYYNAGEPVWMAAESIKQLAHGRVRANREDEENAFIKRMIAGQVRRG